MGAGSTANQALAGGMYVQHDQELDFHRQSLSCQIVYEKVTKGDPQSMDPQTDLCIK